MGAGEKRAGNSQQADSTKQGRTSDALTVPPQGPSRPNSDASGSPRSQHGVSQFEEQISMFDSPSPGSGSPTGASDEGHSYGPTQGSPTSGLSLGSMGPVTAPERRDPSSSEHGEAATNSNCDFDFSLDPGSSESGSGPDFNFENFDGPSTPVHAWSGKVDPLSTSDASGHLSPSAAGGASRASPRARAPSEASEDDLLGKYLKGYGSGEISRLNTPSPGPLDSDSTTVQPKGPKYTPDTFPIDTDLCAQDYASLTEKVGRRVESLSRRDKLTCYAHFGLGGNRPCPDDQSRTLTCKRALDTQQALAACYNWSLRARNRALDKRAFTMIKEVETEAEAALRSPNRSWQDSDEKVEWDSVIGTIKRLEEECPDDEAFSYLRPTVHNDPVRGIRYASMFRIDPPTGQERNPSVASFIQRDWQQIQAQELASRRGNDELQSALAASEDTAEQEELQRALEASRRESGTQHRQLQTHLGEGSSRQSGR